VVYARALEDLRGVEVGKLLPIADISNKRRPEDGSELSTVEGPLEGGWIRQ
jgi:hypothetical protein